MGGEWRSAGRAGAGAAGERSRLVIYLPYCACPRPSRWVVGDFWGVFFLLGCWGFGGVFLGFRKTDVFLWERYVFKNITSVGGLC